MSVAVLRHSRIMNDTQDSEAGEKGKPQVHGVAELDIPARIPEVDAEPKPFKEKLADWARETFTIARIIDELKFFSGLIVIMFGLMTCVWGHFKIPSESMLPTLEVGDHLYVSKFAYGYSKHSLPLGMHKLPGLPDGKIFSHMPKRGDVAVFRNPNAEIIMIKRIAGLPGDKVRMLRGRLYINDKIVERINIDNYLYREDLGNKVGVDVYEEQWEGEKTPHRIYEQGDMKELDNTREFNVPLGHVFFIGDNRDNSADSRAFNGPGFVPLDHLIGRADLMMFSFKRCDKNEGLRCPPFRALKPL